jgi:hypothetical protein
LSLLFLVSLLLLDVSVVSCVVVSPDIAVCLTAVVVSLGSLLARVSSVDAFVSSATVVFNVSAVSLLLASLLFVDLPAVQCGGSGMFIPDPIWANFQKIVEVFTQKMSNMLSNIWVWDPGYGIRKKPIPDPGSRGQKGTGSRMRIRNSAAVVG